MRTQLAKGMRQLADMVEDGVLDGRECPDQALVGSVMMSSAEAVRDIAEKHGVEVETSERGCTRAGIELGTGTRVYSIVPVYRSAVAVEFWHIPKEEPAVRTVGEIEAAA